MVELKSCPFCGGSGFSFLMEDTSECQYYKIKEDVVEVVRCKDCKSYTDNMNDKTLRNGFCGRKTAGIFDVKKPTDYCSYGERRDT